MRHFPRLAHHVEVKSISTFHDALIARLCDGDLDAFEQIYRRFEQPAFTLALRLTGQRENTQEALQDAMLKAFERAALQGLPTHTPDADTWSRLRTHAAVRQRARRRWRRILPLAAAATVLAVLGIRALDEGQPVPSKMW